MSQAGAVLGSVRRQGTRLEHRVEASHDVERLPQRLPFALHALDGLDALVAMRAAVLSAISV